MIQVINRAFDILEYIAGDKSRPHTITEIATHLDINQGTCANIIKTIMMRGYLVQVSKKEGYKLGNKSYYLTDNYDLKDQLKQAAAKYLKSLAMELNEGVILAILKENQRIVLLDEKSTHEIQVINRHSKEVYETSSGRVLLAYQEEEDLNSYLEKYGLPPNDFWPEVNNEDELRADLEKIRKRSLAVQTTKQSIVGLAVPIFKKKKIVASIGVYLPEHRYNPSMHEDIVEGLRSAAEKINAALDQLKAE